MEGRRSGINRNLHLLIFLVLWMCLFSVKAFASDRAGSIELQLPRTEGVEITIYPVALYRDGTFVWNDLFQGCGLEMPDLDSAGQVQTAAEQLAAYAAEQKLQGLKSSGDESGLFRFEGLEPALYLAVQTAGLDLLDVQKVFIPVPYQADEAGSVSYDAVLTLKYSVPEGTVILNKTDGSGNPVAGAVFSLQKKTYVSGEGVLPEGAETGQDGDGKYFWETVLTGLTTNEHGQIVQEHLAFGVYRFVETAAPEGYVLSTVPRYFMVKQAGAVEYTEDICHSANEAVPEVEAVNNRAPGNEKLTVTKRLVDAEGKAVFAEDTVVYVALFQDKERTRRVSAVASIRLKNTTSGTAVFEKLNGESVYYLGETDKDGNLLETGTVGSISFVPAYPEGYEVKLDKDTMQGSMEIQNVYPELPPGYHYGGELTVTKKTVQSGQPLSSTDTFYAALFTDEAHTQRYGDVISLKMNGKSEVSVTVPVSAGTDGQSSVTYYIAETRQDGTPLSQNSSIKFTFQVDKEKVTMSSSHKEEKVTITNEFPKGTSQGSSSSSGGGISSGGGSSSVRTGDDTPWERYAVLMLAAAFTAGMLMVRRLRCRRNNS